MDSDVYRLRKICVSSTHLRTNSICLKGAPSTKSVDLNQAKTSCCFVDTYVSTHPGTAWRCRGCRHTAWVQGGRRGPSAHRSTGAPEPALRWASRLRPGPASSPAGRRLPRQTHKHVGQRFLMITSNCDYMIQS